MKNIFYIVNRDLKNIFKNPAALIVIAALACLPSLYAWLNIAASWDPYSNTRGVSVAVVSLDQGAKIQDKKLNIGDEVVVSLTKNDKLGWEFVSKKEAIKGVKHGDYYAAIIIPKDFSKKLVSVTTDNIEKPEIEYYINEKVNAISPKVTKSGASAVVENIQSNFIKEANKTIMTALNSLGIELENNYVNIEKVRKAIFRLEKEMPNIYSKLQLAKRDLDLVDLSVDKVGESLDRVDDIHAKAEKLNKQLINKLKENETAVDETVSDITGKLRNTQEGIEKIPQFTKDFSKKGEDLDQLIRSLQDRQGKLNDASKQLGEIQKYLKEQDQNLKNSRKIKEIQDSLDQSASDLGQLKSHLQEIENDLKSGNHPSVEMIEKTQSFANEIGNNLDALIRDYETILSPQVELLIKQLEELSSGMMNMMERISRLNDAALQSVQRLKEKGSVIDPKVMKEELENASTFVDSNLERVESVISLLEKAPTENAAITKLKERFEALQDQLEKQQEIIEKAQSSLENGETPSKKVLDQLENSLKETQVRIDEIMKNYDQKTKDSLNQLVKQFQDVDHKMRQKFDQLLDLQKGIDEMLSNLHEAAVNPEKTIEAVEKVINRVDKGISQIDSIQNGLQNFQDLIDSDIITQEIERIKLIQDRLQDTNKSIDRVISHIKDAKVGGRNTLKEVDRISYRMDQSLEDMIQFINGDFSRKYKAITREATRALYDVSDVLEEVNRKIPKVRQVLEKVDKGVGVGKEKLALADKHFPKAKESVHYMANKIRHLEEKGDLDELIDILKNDPARVSKFFAEPISLHEHQLYPIPNYGSAMNPFYTTLSLWVGALLLVSALKVDIDEKEEFKSYETYLGRLITFVGIGVAQAAIVTIGNLWILNTFVVDKLPYVLFGLLISIVFVAIVYTLVSVFGNTGKVLAIILMVMQLGGSGGTFPIQMAPPFFQNIHAFLPFTHAITLLREAIGGIIWGIAWIQIIYLIVYLILALIVGIGLKKFFNKSSDKFMKKAEKSKIVI